MTVAWLGGVYGSIKSADTCKLPDRLRNLKLRCFSLDFRLIAIEVIGGLAAVIQCFVYLRKK